MKATCAICGGELETESDDTWEEASGFVAVDHVDEKTGYAWFDGDSAEESELIEWHGRYAHAACCHQSTGGSTGVPDTPPADL